MKNKGITNMKKLATILIASLIFVSQAFSAEDKIELSSGQTVYAAIYSYVFTGPKERLFNLAAMLSIRNTDLHNQINVISVEYYDNNGQSIKEYVQKPLNLAPLASHQFSIKESDSIGGFGANFIVKWKANKEINPPIIESVMIGTKSGQGISFVSQGKVISENTK